MELLYVKMGRISVMVVLRSPIHANEDYDLYSIVKYSVGCAVEHAFVFTWLICMNGTSQYHHYQRISFLLLMTACVTMVHFL